MQVPIRGRLAQRSLEMVRAVAESGPGCGLIAFLANPESRGTWLAIQEAIRLDVTVVVFPLFSVADLSLPASGTWAVAGAGDPWGQAFRWQGEAAQARLL